jgi:hypothetical protein
LWQSLILFLKYMEFEMEYSFAPKKIVAKMAKNLPPKKSWTWSWSFVMSSLEFDTHYGTLAWMNVLLVDPIMDYTWVMNVVDYLNPAQEAKFAPTMILFVVHSKYQSFNLVSWSHFVSNKLLCFTMLGTTKNEFVYCLHVCGNVVRFRNS